MQTLDTHTIAVVLNYLKEHHEIVFIDYGHGASYYDTTEKQTITDGELIDLIQHDYEQRNK